MKFGRFLDKKIKAKGSVVVILAIISIIGFTFNVLEIMFNLTFLPAYSAILAQFLLGVALWLETKPKKKYYHTSVGEDWAKFVMFLVAIAVMATAIIRVPFLDFLGLATNDTVKTMSALAYLAGVGAIVIEVFLKE